MHDIKISLFVFASFAITILEAQISLVKNQEFAVYNVGVMMASRLDSPFDLERCGPAVDLALEEVNDVFLAHHKIRLEKVQAR